MEVVLVERDAHQRGIDRLHDVVCIFEAVDRHTRRAAELKRQLDAVRLDLLDHLLEHRDRVRLDFVHRCRHRQVHGRHHDDHLALQFHAVRNDLVELCHNGVLFLLGLLHVEEHQRVVGQHLQVVVRVCKPGRQVVDGVLARRDFAVQAFGLDVDVVKTVLLAQVEVLQHGVVLAEAVAAFVESDFHGMFAPFRAYFL